MDRTQIAAAGVSIGASGLLLALGVGLVCDAQRRDAATASRIASSERAARIHLIEAEQARNDAERQQLDQIRARIQDREADIALRRATAREQEAREQEAQLETLVRQWDREARTRVYPAAEAPAAPTAEAVAEMAELAPIRAAVSTGDMARIREAVAQHNTRGGEPVYLHDDPTLAEKGIAVRAMWNRHDRNGFGVTLVAEAPADMSESCTVLVAPGAIVKSGGDGYQDTAPIQARFIHVGPEKTKNRADATICCAQIHSQDPRALPASGLTTHRDPRVGLVAAAAERDHASWGAAQVAIWAVANNVTTSEVDEAPGAYSMYIDPARDVLEDAGIDTNKLPLYASATPRARKATFDLDFLNRLRRG